MLPSQIYLSRVPVNFKIKYGDAIEIETYFRDILYINNIATSTFNNMQKFSR